MENLNDVVVRLRTVEKTEKAVLEELKVIEGELLQELERLATQNLPYENLENLRRELMATEDDVVKMALSEPEKVVEGEAEEPLEAEEELVSTVYLNPADMTVAEIEEYVATDVQQLMDMLSAEIAGKNRKTAIEALNGKIEELQ